MSAPPGRELGRLCRQASLLVRELEESRWPGLSHLRGDASPPAAPGQTLAELEEEVRHCTRCGLAAGRTKSVFGEGAPRARLMFVGEGPGADEDRQGRPFVGAAGRLLDKIIEAMGLRREQVFIANVVKCRPPGNRNPLADEIAACLPYLHRQIDLVGPSVICALGKFAAQALLETGAPISKLRGSFHDYRGVKLMPTFHPSYLLRNPEDKRLVWEDVQQVMGLLGLPLPEEKK